jgi:hypothetical protein
MHTLTLIGTWLLVAEVVNEEVLPFSGSPHETAAMSSNLLI